VDMEGSVRLRQAQGCHSAEHLLAAMAGKGGCETPNVRAKRATTAGRQARAGENVLGTTGPGLVACRWRSA